MDKEDIKNTLVSHKAVEVGVPFTVKLVTSAFAPIDTAGEVIGAHPDVPLPTDEELKESNSLTGLIPGVAGYRRGQLQKRVGMEYEEKFKKKDSKYWHETIGLPVNVGIFAAIGALATALSKNKDKSIMMGALKGAGVGALAQLGGAILSAITPAKNLEQIARQEQDPAWVSYLVPGAAAYKGYKRLGYGYRRFKPKKTNDSSAPDYNEVEDSTEKAKGMQQFANKAQQNDSEELTKNAKILAVIAQLKNKELLEKAKINN